MAPAEFTMTSDISKYSFLLNVSSRREYRDMLTAIYGREAPKGQGSLTLNMPIPAWCDWAYASAFLLEEVHTIEESQEEFIL
ncbi:hypothetical protein EW146_g5830 [Bondarzewia mesenterica]|uniref:Uncharacterized protein n=1 Tax=Bondarzewia mesenterica TaxID=1095465 RepID=A0A4S4LQW3_9AGAM|nr:hypothetical protein EW146_g5830 [Bondarzewia mesenterica]